MLDDLQKAIDNAAYNVELAEVGVREAQLALSQQYQTQSATMRVLEGELAKLKEQYAKMVLTAPFDGRIVDLNYYEYDNVAEYDVVMKIADESILILQGAQYSNDRLINAVRMDALIDSVTYQVSYLPYDNDDYMKRRLRGESLPTRFAPAEGADLPEFGASGSVRIYTGISEDTLILPKACVQQDDIGFYVYADEDGQRVKKYVSVGISNTSSIEILDGLEEGEVVYVGE